MNTDQKYKLLSMMGYKGPKNESLMSSFVESNPAAGAKMGQFMSASKGFNQGGLVPGGGGFQVSWGGERRSFSTQREAFDWRNEQKRLNPSGGPQASTGNATTNSSSTSAPSPFPAAGPTPNPPTSTGAISPSLTPTAYTPSATSNPQDQINQLYQRYLNRDAGQAGMDFYSGLLSSGQIDLAGIEADISRNAATERTVRQTYADMGLNVDQAGLQFYTGLINSGQLTPEQMRQDIQQNIQRAGTTGGTQTDGPVVTGQTPQVTTGGTQQVGAQDQAQQVQQLQDGFRGILGRNMEQGALDVYMQQIAGGRSVEDVLNEIVRSEEAQMRANNQFNEAEALRQAQQNYIQSAFQSPQDLVTGQEVAQVQATDGTLIPTNQGQVTGDVGYQASTIDPNSSIGQAQAPEDIDTATYEAQQISDQLQGTLGDLEAQTADPSAKATVRGQLEILMDDFEDGTPPWASGAMRKASAIMQQRGLGASSMAGQAITQAALEAATNIAQQDAQTYATFELRNLDNRQQTAIFKAQQRITGLFTDQAAVNASRQFGASSENQTNQFMASLQESVSRFNASQVAAIAEINVNSENAAKQFNSQMTDLRERFNASNSLVISQANAQWRQNLNTINTAAQNDANRDYVKTVNAITTAALDQLWQRERDLMTFAFSGSESSLDRELRLLLDEKQEDLVKWQEGKAEDAAWGELLGSVVSKVFDW